MPRDAALRSVGNRNDTERRARQAVCDKYYTIEEMRCLCHRLIKMLEHCLNDKGNPASDLFEKIFDDMYAFFGLISCSQKNIQEIKRIQEIDPLREGKILGDIRAPETR